MPTDRQLDDRISRWLEAEAPTQLPDRVLRATFERTRKTRQQGGWQAVLGRLQMNRFVFALGGAAVLVVAAVLALGISANNPSPDIGGPGSPSPSPAPTAVAPIAEPTSATARPALTETFTSDIHGMSVMYPSGWNVQPATEPWTGDEMVTQESPFADVIYEKEHDSPFIALASQPLAGQSFDDWSDAYLAQLFADDPECSTALDAITVDGATGVMPEVCFVALVSDGQRGYLIWFYRIDDREWVDQVLATVRLRPAEAEPTPAAGGLPEGPFVVEDNRMAMTVTIPASGWTFDRQLILLQKGREDANLPEATILFWSYPAGTEFYVPEDPCRSESTKPDNPATTVDEIAAGLAAQASRAASEPEDVTVGGYAGKSITLHVPADAVPNECEQGEFVSYGTATDPLARYQQGPGQIDELWILDIDGDFLIIDAMYRPDTPGELVEEMRSIAESATFQAP